MIGKSKSANPFDAKEAKYIIIYDKLTKTAAISLKNKLFKHANCVVWNKKVFQSNEQVASNKNKLIIFNEDLVKENLANPHVKQGEILPGIDFKTEGNVLGIIYNESKSPKILKDILKENWGKYVAGIIAPVLLVGGFPGAALISYFITLSEKKKIKVKLYMDAVNKLSPELLEKLYND